MTSSNTGVPDISGSVYSKTQVSVWCVLQEGATLLGSGSLALREPPRAMSLLPLEQPAREKGNARLFPT